MTGCNKLSIGVFALLVEQTSGDCRIDQPSTEGCSLPFPALDDVDLGAYQGRWYQTYASRTVINTFEVGGNCVTADYAPSADGPKGEAVIKVTNTTRPVGLMKILTWPFLEGGERLVVRGKGAQSPDVEGELQVSFFPPGGSSRFRKSNYWIIALGEKKLYDCEGWDKNAPEGTCPQGRNGNDMVERYSWAIVSNKESDQLYVLVRDVAAWEAEFEEDGKLKPDTEITDVTKCFHCSDNKARQTNQKHCPGYGNP